MTRWLLPFLPALSLGCSSRSEPKPNTSQSTPSPRATDTATPRQALVPPQGSEAQAFTERFVEHVRRSYPEVQLKVVRPLAVERDSREMSLANLWHECTTNPTVCDAAMDRWVGVLKSEAQDPYRADDLRLSLFPLEAARANGVIHRPWAGPLAQALVFDSKEAITMATAKQTRALGLADDVLFKRAMTNMEKALAGPIEGEPISENAPNVLVGKFNDSYGAARLLLHKRWASIASSGTLLAAAPARDIAIWVTNPSERDATAFRWLAQQMFQHEPHPFSPAVFRWTPASWVLEDSNTTPIAR